MPRICEFFGIVIKMYFNDHSPAHFHAEYGDHEAVYEIDTMKKLVRVQKVVPLDRFRCIVEFEDGTKKEIDLKPFLRGPIFEPIIHDPAMFHAMRVEGGTLTWENGADIDPDVLYYDLKPSWMEEPIDQR